MLRVKIDGSKCSPGGKVDYVVVLIVCVYMLQRAKLANHRLHSAQTAVSVNSCYYACTYTSDAYVILWYRRLLGGVHD